MRASAERERASCAARRPSASSPRREPSSPRCAARCARRAERAPSRRRRRPTARLGAASERAARAERALRALDEPLPVLAPLAVGDPVEAPEVGVRGTIASIDGDEAEVVGAGGQRVRIALARLRPSRVQRRADGRAGGAA